MPGKHAPSSPWSFYASVARAAVVGTIALGLIVAIVMVTLGSGDRGTAAPEGPPVTTITPTTDVDPSEEPSGSPSVTPSPSPSETGPPGFTAAISVLNATDRSGLAARIRAKLVDEGYRRVTSGNAEPSDRTRLYYRGRSREAADAISRLIPELGEPVPAEADTPKGAVVIILGSDFQG